MSQCLRTIAHSNLVTARHTITKHNEKILRMLIAKEAKEMLKVTHIAMGQNNLCHQNRVSISICFVEKVFEKYFSELDASTQLYLNKLRFISLIRTRGFNSKGCKDGILSANKSIFTIRASHSQMQNYSSFSTHYMRFSCFSHLPLSHTFPRVR